MPRISPVHYQTLIKVFELEGFVVKRWKGDHIILTKPEVKRPVVIKTSPRQVPVTHIRTKVLQRIPSAKLPLGKEAKMQLYMPKGGRIMKKLIRPRLIAIACCIALLALLTGPVAEPGVRFIPGDGTLTIGEGRLVFTIGHVAHTAAADFVADGVDDHIQFQQALDALPAGGGKLIVLAGTYNFGAAVGRAIDNVTIQGIGQATVINRDGINPVFTAGAQSNWVFRDFKTDAGGIELTAARNYTLQNITIGASYIAFRTDVAAEAWDIPTGRTATIVVAASDSSPQSKAQADFVADGVDDQVEIQAAIDALPAGGGKVLLLEGTFNVNPITLAAGRENAIILRPNTSLVGQGRETILRIPTITGRHIVVILAYNTPGVTVKGLTIDLNHGGTLPPAPPWFAVLGIRLVGTLTTEAVVEGNKIFNAAYSENISLHSVSRSIITGNILLDGADGVDITNSHHNVVSYNIIQGGYSDGIDIVLDSHNNTIIGNIINHSRIGITLRHETPDTPSPRNNVIANNTMANTTEHGILLIAARNNTITGNTITNAGHHGISLQAAYQNTTSNNQVVSSGKAGIWLEGASCNNIIKGNNIESSHWSGMRLEAGADDNLILGNHIRNSSLVGHGWDSNFLIRSSNNTICSNVSRAGEMTNLPAFGLHLWDPANNNVVKHNDLRGLYAIAGFKDDLGTNIAYEQHSELFMNVLAASATHIHPAITPDGLGHTDVTSPDVPRNAMIRITNTDTVNAQIPSGGNMIIEGLDARGNTISETLTVPATSIPAGGTSDVFGSKAFATVSKVTYYTETNTAITVSVGIANRIGLPVHSSNFDGVFRVARNGVAEAVGTVDLLNGTVDLGTITTGDDFLIHYRVSLNILR